MKYFHKIPALAHTRSCARRFVALCLLCLLWQVARAQDSLAVNELNAPALVARALNGRQQFDSAVLRRLVPVSPWLGDYFGVLPLGKITMQRLMTDWAALAQVQQVNSNELTLRFNGGGEARAYFNTAMLLGGVLVRANHLYFGGRRVAEYTAALDTFMAVLQRRNWQADYLLANPWHEVEQATAQWLAAADSGRFPPPVPRASLRSFARSKQGIMLLPERTHGDTASLARLYTVLNASQCEWLGLEMLPSHLQPALDTFLLSPENGKPYQEAEAQVLNYLWAAWGTYFPNMAYRQMPYFRLLQWLKGRGVRVYALDTPPEYALFRQGSLSTAGARVRSHYWARQVPAQGRGVVFGGGGHFGQALPGFGPMGRGTVQDFLQLRFPDRPLFVLPD